MRIQDKYRINDITWDRLQKGYTYGILLGSPFAAVVFAFITWPIIDDFSWTLIPIIPWATLYIIILPMHNLFFKQSKYTIFILFLMLVLFAYFFAVMASACVYRLFGFTGIIIQSTFLIVSIIFLCRHYYKYFGRVWKSHKYHNENVVLDQENGRYDFLNNFNLDESKINRKKGKRYSNTALTSLIYLVSPVGGGISLIFSKDGDYTIPLIIGWFLSVPVTLGFTKIIMGAFYNYHKLAYFEKKLGKPIINGLLE